MIGLERLSRLAKLVDHVFGQRDLVPPGFILEVEHPEWQLVGGTRRWTSGTLTLVAGGAGTNAKAEILNPAGSGLLVVVTGAKVTGKATAGAIRLVYDGAALGGQAPNMALDDRVPVGAAAQRNVESQNRISNAGGLSGAVIEHFSALAGGDAASLILPALGFVIAPGLTLGLQNSTANEGATFYFWGYERPALPEELGAV